MEFGPIAANPPASKFVIGRGDSIVSNTFGSIALDYYIDPAAANQDPQQYYLNIYTDGSAVPGPTAFYDCRYDYVSSTPGAGWHRHTSTFAAQTPATGVTTPNKAVCGTSPDQLPSSSTIISCAQRR